MHLNFNDNIFLSLVRAYWADIIHYTFIRLYVGWGLERSDCLYVHRYTPRQPGHHAGHTPRGVLGAGFRMRKFDWGIPGPKIGGSNDVLDICQCISG